MKSKQLLSKSFYGAVIGAAMLFATSNTSSGENRDQPDNDQPQQQPGS
jgi:hypothetical protein